MHLGAQELAALVEAERHVLAEAGGVVVAHLHEASTTLTSCAPTLTWCAPALTWCAPTLTWCAPTLTRCAATLTSCAAPSQLGAVR